VRVKVLTVASVKMAVFWVLVSRSVAEVYDCADVLVALYSGLMEISGNCNVGTLPDYTTQEPGRQPYSLDLMF
jgi:hypothetical protein